jgi:hypothetical protein
MTGDHCTAVGHNCLTRNSTGQWNIGIGSDTLTNVTTGSFNTALGGYALTSLTTGSNDVAVGWAALSSSVTSTYPSVAVGYGALINYNNSNGGANVAIGHQSLGALTTGIGNIAIGYLADNSNVGSSVKNTTSNNNICIGNQASSNGNANCIVLGEGAHANANNQIIIGRSGGGQTTWIQGNGGLQVNSGPTVLNEVITSGSRIMFSPNSGLTTSVPASSAGLVLGCNYNAGQGETDFLNYSQGGGEGGFEATNR